MPGEDNVPAAAYLNLVQRFGTWSAHGQEAAPSDRTAEQQSVLSLKGDGELWAVEGEGQQETAIGLQLVQPFRGNIPASNGEDDAIIGRILNVAAHTVATNHLHLFEAGSRQIRAGRLH